MPSLPTQLGYLVTYILFQYLWCGCEPRLLCTAYRIFTSTTMALANTLCRQHTPLLAMERKGKGKEMEHSRGWQRRTTTTAAATAHNNTNSGFGGKGIFFPSFLYLREGAAAAAALLLLLLCPLTSQPREYPVAGLEEKGI